MGTLYLFFIFFSKSVFPDVKCNFSSDWSFVIRAAEPTSMYQ